MIKIYILLGMGLGENIIEEINRDISTIPALGGRTPEEAFFNEVSFCSPTFLSFPSILEGHKTVNAKTAASKEGPTPV
jgi:hypothetical protein